MLKPDTGYRFRNWDETLECRPERFYQPESEEEVLEIIREASDAGGTVRTLGAGHSKSQELEVGALLWSPPARSLTQCYRRPVFRTSLKS
jgi:hypothetical protein